MKQQVVPRYIKEVQRKQCYGDQLFQAP
jgi:hypothetical protein